MKITLPNGMMLEGTELQIMEVASKLGYRTIDLNGYYNSSTHGLLRIKDMNTTHLRNAILKQYREWVASLSSISNPQALVHTIQEGIIDKTWLNMVTEYATREEE